MSKVYFFLRKKDEQVQIKGDCVEGHSVPVSLTSMKSNTFTQIDSFLFSSEEFFQSTSSG
jgi:hypothetical protein